MELLQRFHKESYAKKEIQRRKIQGKCRCDVLLSVFVVEMTILYVPSVYIKIL